MRLAAIAGMHLILAGLPDYAYPAPQTTAEGNPSGAPIGQFSLGAFTFTPTFQIGTMAVDTNIQYKRDRRADFVASAGPGLDLELPFLDHWKLDIQGTSQYFYFHRTKELRRWTGAGVAKLLWATTGTRASLSTTTAREFARPSFEVDTRVASRQRNLIGMIERDLGRLTLQLRASFRVSKVDRGQEYRGADLATALTTNRYEISPQFRYRLTPLSSLLVEGGYEATRFPKASARAFDQRNAGLGFLTTGFFNGQVTAGFRQSTLSGSSVTSTRPYLRGNLSQKVGRRLTLRESYAHESSVSAFAVDGSLPTYERRSLGLQITIEITKRIDLRLDGTQEKLKSDGLVQVILDDGSTASAKRDDVAYQGRANLGIRLGRARFGAFASYTTRESLFFADLGIQGLQVGARVEYAP